jgi:plasmid maintenance system antidote protein VapI
MNKKSRPSEQYIQENRELAEIMEVNRSTISKVETGKFAITIDYLVKFAWYLDFNISVLEKQGK